MDKKIINHFRSSDPILFSIITKIGKIKSFKKSENYFSDLCRIIINQQLSDKVSYRIFIRLTELFPGKIISPKYLLQLPDDKIKTIGTSKSKIIYMKNIAQKFITGEIDPDKLNTLNDGKVITEMTKIKGIGKWSAEMFLMTALAREDVFSYGDLGIRRAIQKLYKLKKEPTLKQAEKISKKWSPYKTYACRILWNYLEI